ncbi:unnamed protein product [Clonostachys rosea]|uniref:CMP/dCMP-type deaminase domain-containing protein n=1 Tax=Bionectria ochroleuca TaxID=29856 RepID=A0ABY6UL11_BIOOC|nr:unnamed protein product [Clonostachys rosea]
MSPNHIAEAVAMCEEPCGSAALEACRIGMVEGLCHPDSEFIKVFRPCATCLQQIPQLPIKIEPSGLSPFLSFCGMEINHLEIRKPPDDSDVASWHYKIQIASTSSDQPTASSNPYTSAPSVSSGDSDDNAAKYAIGNKERGKFPEHRYDMTDRGRSEKSNGRHNSNYIPKYRSQRAAHHDPRAVKR